MIKCERCGELFRNVHARGFPVYALQRRDGLMRSFVFVNLCSECTKKLQEKIGEFMSMEEQDE